MAFTLISHVEREPEASQTSVALKIPTILLPRAVTTIFWACAVVLEHMALLWLLLNLSPPSLTDAGTAEIAILAISNIQAERQEAEDEPVATVAEKPATQAVLPPATVPEWSMEQVRVKQISSEPAESISSPSTANSPVAPSARAAPARGSRGGQYDPYAGVAPMRQNMLPQGAPNILHAPPSPTAKTAANKLQLAVEEVQAELKKRFPNDRGTVVARIRTGPGGKVEHVEILQATVSSSVRIAVLSALRKIRLDDIQDKNHEVVIII